MTKGAKARAVLQAVTDADVSNTGFPYMTGRFIKITGQEVWAQRVTYVGELGWEFYMHPEAAGAVWDALMAAGNEHGLRPGGYKALDSLRLEKAYRYWSSDITPSETPYEAGLGFCVKLNKGDFIGREALLAQKARGVQRKLTTIVLSPLQKGDPFSAAPSALPQGAGGLGVREPIIYGGEAVFANGQVAGRLRSGGYGYTVSKHIGFIYLPLDLAKVGTPLEVEIFGERYPATVEPDVLYDPKGERIKS